MVGWHHRLNGHEFEQAPGVGDGQGGHSAVHGVAKSQTQLSNFTFAFHFHELEKEWQPTPVFLPGESRDGGAWSVAAYAVTKSWTRLR